MSARSTTKSGSKAALRKVRGETCIGRGDLEYRSVGEQDVLDVMDRVMERFLIDPDRVSLAGHSMGAFGTWRMGILMADRFACIVAMAGRTGVELLGNLRNLPVFAIHGNADDTVPADSSRRAAQELKRLGFQVRNDEIPGANHDTWGWWRRTHPAASILDFFRTWKRNASPERITAAVPSVRYGSQYWIRVEELSSAGGSYAPPGRAHPPVDPNILPDLPAPGTVDALRVSSSSLLIKTGNVSAMSVDLARAGLDAAADRIIVVDGSKIDAPRGASVVSLVRTADSGWEIAESPRRLADWRATPEITLGARSGGFNVAADTAVSLEELQSHGILLIGDWTENSVTERVADSIRPYYDDDEPSVGGSRSRSQIPSHRSAFSAISTRPEACCPIRGPSKTGSTTSSSASAHSGRTSAPPFPASAPTSWCSPLTRSRTRNRAGSTGTGIILSGIRPELAKNIY